MRKSLISILCLSFLCCLFLFAACKDDRNYREGVYEYVPDYKSVTSNIMQGENIELHVENGISESKDKITEIYGVFDGIYDKLDKAFGLKTQIKCYVIADEYILGESKAVYQNNVLLCNESVIRSNDFKRGVTAAYIRSTELWKQYGAYAHVFGCEYDNNLLKQYYSNGNDLELTLFQAYFIDDFSDTDTSDIAIRTACSLGDFLIENYGYEKFISANLTDYRTEYLKYLGVDRKFSVDFDLSWLDGAEYSQKFLSYPLVIKTANRAYNLDALSSKRETASFDTPERVLYHLSEGEAELEKILIFIKENAAESYEFVSKRYAENIEYYISDSEIKTCCDVGARKIYLLDPSEFIHETIHAITLQNNPTAEAWIGEGVAEYLSRYVSKHVSDINNRFYLSFTDKTLTGSIADFVSEVNSLYEEKGGKFDNLSKFDFALIEECIGITTLKDESFKSRIQFPCATNPIYKTYACLNKDGNALTYPEAYAFTKYLIDKYGFSSVIKSCKNYDLKRDFENDYDGLFNDFKESVS